LKLLLDEQFPPDIARRVREQGHDAIAVCERSDLISAEDEALLALSATQGRALLTNNVRDLIPIATRWVSEGQSHHGLLLVSDRTLPRSRNTIGAYVRALDQFLRAHPAEDALRDQVRWLTADS
jgi:predicted nuclease of predicted toxin-antitoxin system